MEYGNNPINVKKEVKRECNNYRGITLTNLLVKIIAKILERRIRKHLENTLEKSEYGLKQNRSTQDTIFIIGQTIEKNINKNKDIHNTCSLDIEKGFDRIKRKDT